MPPLEPTLAISTLAAIKELVTANLAQWDEAGIARMENL